MWSNPNWPGNRLRERPAPNRRRKPCDTYLAQAVALALALGLLAGVSGTATASPAPVTMNGVPEQVIPAVPEVGLGSFSMPSGTASIGSDSTVTGSDGASNAVDLSGSSYDTLMSQSWGALAASNAQTIGVNPVAVAATCVVESGCQNITGSGSITGAFQMMNSTYTAAMAAATADHPELASATTSGLAGQNDPATQSIAAAEYLKQAAQNLQAAGISNPTVLDVRGSYNFGPGNGALIAQATDDQLMSSVLSSMSASTLTANGISSTTTVGQWRSNVSSKIGTAATQSVLLGT